MFENSVVVFFPKTSAEIAVIRSKKADFLCFQAVWAAETKICVHFVSVSMHFDLRNLWLPPKVANLGISKRRNGLRCSHFGILLSMERLDQCFLLCPSIAFFCYVDEISENDAGTLK